MNAVSPRPINACDLGAFDGSERIFSRQLLEELCKLALYDMSTPSAAELIETGRSKLLASGHAEPFLVDLARSAKVR